PLTSLARMIARVPVVREAYHSLLRQPFGQPSHALLARMIAKARKSEIAKPRRQELRRFRPLRIFVLSPFRVSPLDELFECSAMTTALASAVPAPTIIPAAIQSSRGIRLASSRLRNRGLHHGHRRIFPFAPRRAPPPIHAAPPVAPHGRLLACAGDPLSLG